MASNYKMSYPVDIVFCIDATGSMENIIERVKKNAVNFYNDVTNAMINAKKNINSLRVKIITFRDYLEDGDNAMLMTDFFSLPEQSYDFESCINSIEAFGGGDDPEDGLEALAYAIKSDWTTEGVKRRQIIVVWTDAPVHQIGFGKKAENYPSGMPSSFDQLTSWWGDSSDGGFMNQNSKRLVLFAPDISYWRDISNLWDNVVHYPSIEDRGLYEYDYQEIINSIVNSI